MLCNKFGHPTDCIHSLDSPLNGITEPSTLHGSEVHSDQGSSNIALKLNMMSDGTTMLEHGYSNVEMVLARGANINPRSECCETEKTPGLLSQWLGTVRISCDRLCSSVRGDITNESNLCCYFCGKYDVAELQNMESKSVNQKDNTSKGCANHRIFQCSTKFLCLVISISVLAFLAAGAILLHQSCK